MLWKVIFTHWGRVKHICVSKLTIISSDNGLSPRRRQAIIWTNAGILLIRNEIQWNFNRNSYVFIQENAFENVVCEMAATLFRPQCVNSPQFIFEAVLSRGCASDLLLFELGIMFKRMSFIDDNLKCKILRKHKMLFTDESRESPINTWGEDKFENRKFVPLTTESLSNGDDIKKQTNMFYAANTMHVQSDEGGIRT